MRPVHRLRTARLRRSAHPVGIQDAIAAVTDLLRARGSAPRTLSGRERFDELGLDSVDVAECVIALELAVRSELEFGAIGPVERVEDLLKLRRATGSVGP